MNKMNEKKTQNPLCLIDIHIAVDRATARSHAPMIEPDQFDEKLAGGGSGPTICWGALKDGAAHFIVFCSAVKHFF